MTPREILAKYGLKTDVKSIRERIAIERNEKYGYWESSKQYAESNQLRFFGNIMDECFKADLDLLCEMAEKVEKIGEVVELDMKQPFMKDWQLADSYKEVVKILKGDAK